MSRPRDHTAGRRPQAIRLGLLVPRAVCGATFEGGTRVCARQPDHRGDHRDGAGVAFEAADADQERAR